MTPPARAGTPAKIRAAQAGPTAGLLPARTLGANERKAAVQQAAARRAALTRSLKAPKRAVSAPPAASAIVVTAPDPDLVGTSSLGEVTTTPPADGGAEAPVDAAADGAPPVTKGPEAITPTTTSTSTGTKPGESGTGTSTAPATSGSGTTGGTSGGGTTAPGTTQSPGTSSAPAGPAGPRGDGSAAPLP